jgi:hypothetical protein
VAALVGGEASFLLQDGEAQGGEAARDFHGDGESDNPPPMMMRSKLFSGTGSCNGNS